MLIPYNPIENLQRYSYPLFFQFSVLLWVFSVIFSVIIPLWAESTEEEIDIFYETLEKAKAQCKSDEINIIIEQYIVHLKDTALETVYINLRIHLV